MVTVVKPQEVKQVKCRKCGSTLEYVFTEIQERKTVDYGGGRDTYRFIVCPYCGKEGDYKNMKRWHMDNCKNNPDYVDRIKMVTCNVCGFSTKESSNFYRNHNDYCRGCPDT